MFKTTIPGVKAHSSVLGSGWFPALQRLVLSRCSGTEDCIVWEVAALASHFGESSGRRGSMMAHLSLDVTEWLCLLSKSKWITWQEQLRWDVCVGTDADITGRTESISWIHLKMKWYLQKARGWTVFRPPRNLTNGLDKNFKTMDLKES